MEWIGKGIAVAGIWIGFGMLKITTGDVVEVIAGMALCATFLIFMG